MQKLLYNFISFLIIILILIIIFNFKNFYYYQFGDRDLLRALYLKETFQLFGAELNHLDGLRFPGGFLYYFIYFLQTFSKKIELIFLFSLLINLLSLIVLAQNFRKIFNYNISIIFLFIILSSSSFLELLFRLWNPSLGFGFAILSLCYVIKNLIKVKKKYIFLFLFFGLIAFQFHTTYILPLIYGIIHVVIKKKYRQFLIITFFFLFFILLIPSTFYLKQQFQNPFQLDLINKKNNFIILEEKDISKIEIQKKNLSKEINSDKTIIDNYFIFNDKIIKTIDNKTNLIFTYDDGGIYYNLPILFSFFIIIGYIIKLKNPNLNLAKDRYWKNYLIIFKFFLLIIIISTIAYFAIYKNLVIGLSNRYHLVPSIIMAVILAFNIVLIENFLKNYYKIFFLILIVCFSLFKILAVQVSLNNSFDNQINNLDKKEIKEILISKLKLDPFTIYSNVLAGHLNNENLFLYKPNLTIDYIFNEQTKIRDKINIYNQNRNCFLIIKNNKNLLDVDLNNIDFLKKRIIQKVEKYKNFYIVNYLNNLPCYTNLSNDYIIFNYEKDIFNKLKDLKNNKVYSIKVDNSIIFLTKILINENYQASLNTKIIYKNIPLHLLIKFNKNYSNKELNFTIISYQLRNNVNVGGHLKGYNIKNIKLQIYSSEKENKLLNETNLENIFIGKDPGTIKSPLNISIPMNNWSRNKVKCILFLENINNNVEWGNSDTDQNIRKIEFNNCGE